MSILGKRWKIINNDNTVPILEKLLKNRKINTRAEKIEFLKADFEQLNNSPFLFREMNKAVERVYEAIKNNERIIVFGDYDVDGISGTAILIYILNKLGAQVSYRLPHRIDDGYGLSKKFVSEFKELNLKLLITVDCGISCFNEVNFANEQGIDVIITDHHSVPANVPNAFAVLHPLRKGEKYPYPFLTGAGVALKFAQALLEKSNLPNIEFDKNLIIAYASMGTIGDLGPLNGENRAIVKKGLELLRLSEWRGIKFLKKIAGIKDGEEITSTSIGFRLAPRLNAAGRIDTPYLALKLLLNNDESESEKMAEKLDQLNRERQVMTARAIKLAEEMVEEQAKKELLLIVHSKEWHSGILGLIAGKLAEKFHRPAIIMEDRDSELVGSARSPISFSIIQALNEQKSFLNHFGGHKQAAGFSINRENLDIFIKNMQNYARNTVDPEILKPELLIDCEMPFNEVDIDLFNEIKDLEPFGVENEEPVFLLTDVKAISPKVVGNNNTHLKFFIASDDKKISAIAFNFGQYFDYLLKKDKFNVVCSLGINKWNDVETLQLKVLDMD